MAEDWIHTQVRGEKDLIVKKKKKKKEKKRRKKKIRFSFIFSPKC